MVKILPFNEKLCEKLLTKGFMYMFSLIYIVLDFHERYVFHKATV